MINRWCPIDGYLLVRATF